MNADPVTIVPRFVDRVWGRTDLGGWYPGQSNRPGGEPMGEAWLTDVACGLDGGGTFGAWLAADPDGTLGADASTGHGPILVKMLFTAQALSVQVHPTDEAARAGGIAPTGKNEAWHILDAAPDAAVEAGFKAPVTAAQLRTAIADGTVMDLMARQTVRAGDTVPVRAGTVHAIGAGLVLLEVQDPVPVTYRLYDYGRPRELQVDDGLAVAALGPATGGEWARDGNPVLVEAPRFVLERRTIRDGLVLTPDGARYHLLVPLTDGVRLDGRDAQRGVAVCVPARGRPVALDGAGTLAVVHPGPGATPCL